MKKATTGQNFNLKWFATAPLTAPPNITFQTTPVVSGAMSPIRSSIAVTAISQDRRTLTIANQTTGLQEDEKAAFLITSGDGYFSVKLTRILGTVAILAEPLPKEIDLSNAGSLEFALYYYTASSANITAESKTIRYSVDYTLDTGSLTELKKDSSILKVTPRPFETGLTHDELVSQYNQLAGMIPRRQTDFQPQIDKAFIELVFLLRDRLQPLEITEDEIFDCESFKPTHIYLTTAIVYESNDRFDLGEQYRIQANNVLDLAFRSVALDLNKDGVIDDGELDLRESGGSSKDVDGSFASYVRTGEDKRFIFKRGMRH